MLARLVALGLLLIPLHTTLAQPGTLSEVDTQMAAFAAAWAHDDAEAVRGLMADDVVLLSGSAGDATRGAEAVMGWARTQMEATSVLLLVPMYSRMGDGRAYQVGHWRLGPATGVHTFAWERDPAGAWRLASLYILDDATD